MSDYGVGDLIEARKGDTMIRGVLDADLRLEDAGWGVLSLDRWNWAVEVIEKAEPPLPDLPTKTGAVVLVETEEGRHHFLGWRAADDWDVITPRGMANITDDLYRFAREWSESKISAVTILTDGAR